MTNEFQPADLQSTLELYTDDLKLRRKQLEAELRSTVVKLVSEGVKNMLTTELKGFAVDVSKVKSVSWDFYYESDDQGGTDPYMESISINMVDGEEELYLDEITVEKVSSWSGDKYEVSLGEELNELFYEFKNDLHDYGIEEIELN